MAVLRTSPSRVLRAALLVSLAPLVGCDDASGYRPFDATHYTGTFAVTARLHDMAELSDTDSPSTASATYAAILSDYTTPLTEIANAYAVADEVVARGDDHAYGTVDRGTYLDGQMRAAIALGMGTTSTGYPQHDLRWAHEAVEYLGLAYTYLTVYHELSERHRAGLDEAWGAYSFVKLSDGTPIGLFANAEEREQIFHVPLNAPLAALWPEARAIVVANTTGDEDPVGANADLDATIDRVDRGMLRIFAYGCRHYLENLRDGGASGADGDLVEARLLWLSLRPWAEHTDATSAAKVTAALYPHGEAATNDPGLHAAYGLVSYIDVAYDGDATAALSALATITAALEAP